MMNKISFVNNAVKFGLFLASFSIILSLVYYILEVQMFTFSFIAGNIILGLLFVISFFIFGIRNYRAKGLDGKITFGQAFAQGLAIGIVGYLIIGAYNYIFNAYIAPEYAASQLDGFTQFMEKMNVPDETLDKAISDFQTNMQPFNQLKSALVSGGIMSLIISAIVAASIKKDTTEAEIV